MKTKIVLFAVAVFVSLTAHAQRKVALHHNGTATMFGGATMYQDAYNTAVNGDTIYLPGGTFAGINIAKQLTIIGSGFHPDSTTATGNTVVSSFTMTAGAAKSHLEGLYIDGGVSNTGTNDSITVKRCYIHGSLTVNGKGIIIDGNVIRQGLNGTNSTNAVVKNNILSEGYYPIRGFYGNSWIVNNVILKSYGHSSYYPISSMTDCLIENNVIFTIDAGQPITAATAQNNTFKNNVLSTTIGGTQNTWENNYENITPFAFFNTFSWSNPITYFTLDYHLQNPTTYLGTDGTQVGIFGGLYPCKEGAVPQNPHIQIINNAATTDTNGNLQIQIQVEAQND